MPQATYESDELRDVIDEMQIRRLHAAYVDAVNRFAWSEFHELFVPDAALTVQRAEGDSDDVIGPAAIGELIGGYVSHYDFLTQVVLNARVRLRYHKDIDQACARLYIAEYRQVSASGRRLESAGVYHDQYRRIEGSWWFVRRRYDRLYKSAPADLEVHPFPIDSGAGDFFADDVSAGGM